MVFPQENLTLLAEPNRVPMGSKAGLLCAAAARGDPGLFAQNRLRNGIGTGTGTSTGDVLSFSCGFRRTVGTGGVRNAGGAARWWWGGGGGNGGGLNWSLKVQTSLTEP
jgi:hypothetical protein